MHASEWICVPGSGALAGFLQAVDHLPALLALDLNLIRKRRPQRREQREANLAQVLAVLGALKRGEEHRGALLDHGRPWLRPRAPASPA